MKQLLTIIFSILFMGILSAQQSNLKVDQDRLEKRIFDLAEFGLQTNGETERVAFSDADIEARNWVIKTLEDFGMEVKVDAAGNIIGTRKGSGASLMMAAWGLWLHWKSLKP